MSDLTAATGRSDLVRPDARWAFWLAAWREDYEVELPPTRDEAK